MLDYGGGVCQASSTLYNAVLLAGLEIEEHHSHFFAPSYIPAGRDCAVSPGEDFRFKNNTSYPIRIFMTEENQYLVCKIFSKDKNSFHIKLITKIESLSILGKFKKIN